MLVEEGLQVSLKEATLSQSQSSRLESRVHVLIWFMCLLCPTQPEWLSADDPKAVGLGARAEAGGSWAVS